MQSIKHTWTPFNSIEEIAADYRNTADYNNMLFDRFRRSVLADSALVLHKQHGDHLIYGEVPFHYLWKLIAAEMPDNSCFLEIGVYRGQVVSLILMLSDLFGKTINVTGISTFDGLGDKYSKYPGDEYRGITERVCARFSSQKPFLIIADSRDAAAVKNAAVKSPYFCIYIDGGHDYETVMCDIHNYSSLVEKGGYLVMDDASTDREGSFWKGHPDVGRAVSETLDCSPDYRFMFSVGHLKLFKKIQ